MKKIEKCIRKYDELLNTHFDIQESNVIPKDTLDENYDFIERRLEYAKGLVSGLFILDNLDPEEYDYYLNKVYEIRQNYRERARKLEYDL